MGTLHGDADVLCLYEICQDDSLSWIHYSSIHLFVHVHFIRNTEEINIFKCVLDVLYSLYHNSNNC